MSNYLAQLEAYSKEGIVPADIKETMKQWYFSYKAAALANGQGESIYEPILDQFLKLVVEQLKHPYTFEPYHQSIRKPVDLYQVSIDFVRPLVNMQKSQAVNLQYADQMTEQLAKGDNVILLANHQTELDPQAISLLLEKTHPKLAEEMIFVAGHRVVSDPMAAPFSKGCNLLCIYSKKYIDGDPLHKEEKRLHNQRVMKQMGSLLSEGGKCIYVAPSGGRDRRNRQGKIEVAAFDPQSIELFSLTAQKAGRSTHFYPLALATYALLPPPDTIRKQLGEPRVTKATPIALAFGAEIDMVNFPGSDVSDKKVKRKLRAQYIWEQVKADYDKLEDKIKETR